MSESTSAKQAMDYLPDVLPDVPTGRSCSGDPQSLSRDTENGKNLVPETQDGEFGAVKRENIEMDSQNNELVEKLIKRLEVQKSLLSNASKEFSIRKEKCQKQIIEQKKNMDGLYNKLMISLQSLSDETEKKHNVLEITANHNREILEILKSQGAPDNEATRGIIDNIKTYLHRCSTDLFPYPVFTPNEPLCS